MATETPVPRLSLVEDYDRTFGFLEDAIVDATPQRKTLMARPSVRYTTDMGAWTSHGNLPGTVFINSFLVFEVNFPTTSLYPARTSQYAAWIYSAGSAPAHWYMAVYSLTRGVMLGEQDLGVALNRSGYGKITPAVGTYSTAHGATVVAGGAGYAVNDTITLVATGDAIATVLKVTIIGGGGSVSSVDILSSGFYSATPANPVAQNVSSGGGTGATFNLTYDALQGVVGQPNSAFTQLIEGAFINTYSDLVQFVSIPQSGSFANPLVASIEDLSDYNWTLDILGNLYNSNPGDVLTWDGLSFTQAFSNSGSIPRTLAVHQGYLVAFANNEVRFFTVTGASPGSAAAPVLNVSYGIGALSNATVASANEYLGFVGSPDDTGYPVYLFSPNSQVPERVSYPYLENQLKQTTPVTAAFVTFRGHFAFCVNTSDGHSYVFDLHTKLWYRWNPFATAQGYALELVSVYANATYAIGFDTSSTHWYLMGVQAANTDLQYGGATVAYTPYVVLKPLDYGTMTNKQWQSVTLVGDQPSGALNAQLTYSDNDGQTFASPVRTIALNQRKPIARNLGSSIRRMWKLILPADWAARLDAVEVKAVAGSM